VVLLHGYGGTQDEVLPLANQLHEAGFSVFSYDQRGCGASTAEITFGAREQEDLISVVDYLSSRPDVDRERLGVFGFSMGGATAIMAAAREPRLKAVVADSAWSDVRAWLRPSVKDSFLHPRDPFTALSLKLAARRTGIDLDDLRPADVVGRISPRPILLIHGRADEVIRASEAERNHGAAREPKELVLVSGAAHGDTIAPDGASLRGHVRDFFERALRRRAKVAA
jgi:dipeptidyl aminopeptidase/acylaminoacyl peptidase